MGGMIGTLQTQRVRTREQVRALVGGNKAVDFAEGDRAGAHALGRRTLVQLGYQRLGKRDKGLVKRYVGNVTGCSRAQLMRLIHQHRETGRIEDRGGGVPVSAFERQRPLVRVRRARDVADGSSHGAHTGQAVSPDDPGQDRALAPIDEERDPAATLLPARSTGIGDRSIR